MARSNLAAMLLLAMAVGSAFAGPLDYLTGGRADIEELGKKDHKKPWFCRGKDCPHFDVEHKAEGYELRTYEKAAWVTYNTTGLKFELAMGRAFTGLYRYFSGNNKGEHKMDLTTPYVTEMNVTEGSTTTERNYTIGLLVPHEFQDDVPKPTLDTLEIVHIPETSFYVKEVGGFATEATFLEERNKLRDALKTDGRSYDEDTFFAAVYDAPTKLTDRYNEVWIRARKDKHHHRLEVANPFA